MKILIAVRLFSGLRKSIETGNWVPTGAPTIYKLLEALCASGHEVKIVFTRKEGDENKDPTNDTSVWIQGLESDARVLAGENRFPRWFGRFRWYLNEIRQTHQLKRMAISFDPDLIYIDRGNLWAASALANQGQAPVMYRIMGVNPGLKSAFEGNHPRNILTRKQLRAPFTLALCSLDGSGGEIWLDRMLAPEVDQVLALNGVDIHAAKDTSLDVTLPSSSTTVLFLGRLDPIKGCEEFLEAFHRAFVEDPEELRAVIIGDGSYASVLKQKSSQLGIGHAVTFTGALPHSKVLSFLEKTNIYVSLNKMGNLSNANLEAMRSGCCMIIPSSRPDDGVDVATDEMFPADVILRIEGPGDVEGLGRAILRLHRDPEMRTRCANETARLAAGYTRSWIERIDAEMRLIETFSSDSSAVQRQAAIQNLNWSAEASHQQ
jgi:glycosyltransferase involved in cell wall biosynthesis